MLKGVFESLLGKFGVVALLVAGAAGGMVATGAVPGFGSTQPATPAEPQVAFSAGSGGTTLDFPMSVLGDGAGTDVVEVGNEPAVEVIEEVVVVPAAHVSSAPAPAPVPAAVPAPECVGAVSAVLDAVVAALPSVTTSDQAQALLAQAGALATVADSCAEEAARVGYAGVDSVVALETRAVDVLDQIQSLPLLANLGSQGDGQGSLVGGAAGVLGDLLGGALDLTGGGLGFLGQALQMAGEPLGQLGD